MVNKLCIILLNYIYRRMKQNLLLCLLLNEVYKDRSDLKWGQNEVCWPKVGTFRFRITCYDGQLYFRLYDHVIMVYWVAKIYLVLMVYKLLIHPVLVYGRCYLLHQLSWKCLKGKLYVTSSGQWELTIMSCFSCLKIWTFFGALKFSCLGQPTFLSLG